MQLPDVMIGMLQYIKTFLGNLDLEDLPEKERLDFHMTAKEL